MPIPSLPSVAEVLVLWPLLDPAGEPKYISFFFFTPGVASVVDLASFWHLEQTILIVMVVDVSAEWKGWR